MPIDGHDIAQQWVINSVVSWMNNGILSKEEWRGLIIGFGTTLELHISPFLKSQKEPDIYIWPYNSGFKVPFPDCFQSRMVSTCPEARGRCPHTP